MDFNPYQSPETSEDRPTSSGIQFCRDGDLLIVRPTARLPRQCVVCNRTAMTHYVDCVLPFSTGGLFKFNMNSRAHPSCKLPLCDEHASPLRLGTRLRSIRKYLTLGCALGGLFAFVMVGGDLHQRDIILMALVGAAGLLLIAAVFHLIGSLMIGGRLRLERSDEFMWISGAHRDYLAALPEIAGLNVAASP